MQLNFLAHLLLLSRPPPHQIDYTRYWTNHYQCQRMITDRVNLQQLNWYPPTYILQYISSLAQLSLLFHFFSFPSLYCWLCYLYPFFLLFLPPFFFSINLLLPQENWLYLLTTTMKGCLIFFQCMYSRSRIYAFQSRWCILIPLSSPPSSAHILSPHFPSYVHNIHPHTKSW